MDIAKGTFAEINSKDEGIVLLGAGGDLVKWVDGVTKVLNDEGCATGTPDELWGNAVVLTTTGGRTDLVLAFAEDSKFNMGKMAMWRLRFGECSWIGDYVDNYATQH